MHLFFAVRSDSEGGARCLHFILEKRRSQHLSNALLRDVNDAIYMCAHVPPSQESLEKGVDRSVSTLLEESEG